MLIPVVKITIEQVPNATYPLRNFGFELTFVTEYEIESTWMNLTDTAKLKFPKNVYYKGTDGRIKNWQEKSMVANLLEDIPIFSRGDKIKIEDGYYDTPYEVAEMNVVFEGFITKINNRIPLEIECEDPMFHLKQTACPSKVFLGSQYTAETMIRELLQGVNAKFSTNYTVRSDNYSTNVGDFRTLSTATVAMVLEELRSKYHCESYFRKVADVWELRAGLIKYYPGERINHIFHFQKNIISDNLIYTRLDDIRIGVKAYSINKEELQTVNKNGQVKTKHKRLETTAGDTDGEMRTLYFYNVQTEAELKAKAETILPKLKYEGFHGDFTTFGLPAVKHGDSVTLLDAIIPERNNTTYLVKGVTRTGGVNGIRQRINLDFRIDTMTAEQLQSLQTNGA